MKTTKPNAFADIAGLFVLLCAALMIVALAVYLTGCSSGSQAAPVYTVTEAQAACIALYAAADDEAAFRAANAQCGDGGAP